MRYTLLSVAAWAGVIQAVGTPAVQPVTLEGAAKLIGLASVLGSLTVLVYRLGVWRQQLETSKDMVLFELRAGFERLERRLDHTI